MKEIQQDFWSAYKDYDAIVCPTNGVVKKNLELVMGGGLAKQFKEHFPYVASAWGTQTEIAGQQVHLYRHDDSDLPDLYSFPSKIHWRDSSDLGLIEKSAGELVRSVDYWKYERILVPKIGCGLGGLTWDQVKPILEEHLDERFTIISP